MNKSEVINNNQVVLSTGKHLINTDMIPIISVYSAFEEKVLGLIPEMNEVQIKGLNETNHVPLSPLLVSIQMYILQSLMELKEKEISNEDLKNIMDQCTSEIGLLVYSVANNYGLTLS